MQSASALAQKEFHGEYLVVWSPADNRLDVPICRSHQFGDVICEFCDRGTRKLLGRGYELRDTALSFLGVDDFVFVERFIFGSGSVVSGDHSLVLLDIQDYGYALSVFVHYVTSVHSVNPFAWPLDQHVRTHSQVRNYMVAALA